MKSKQDGDLGGAELDRLRARLEQTEAALRREQGLARLIAETIPVGIVTVDFEGRITSANTGAEELLGLTRDEITDRTDDDPRWRIVDGEGAALGRGGASLPAGPEHRKAA